MTDRPPAYIPLDQNVKLAVNGSTRFYLEELAATSHDLEGAAELEGDGLRAYLIDRCAPKEGVATSFYMYVAMEIASKVVSLACAKTALENTLSTFLGDDDFQLIAGGLLVNPVPVMERMHQNMMTTGDVMLLPIKGGFTPRVRLVLEDEGVEEADFDRPTSSDILIGVIEWEGHYLCQTALVDLDDLEHSFKQIEENIPIKRPNVFYRQGKKKH